MTPPPAETVVVNENALTTVPSSKFDEGLDSALTYGSASGIDGGVECPGGAGIRCVVTGDGTSGASASWGSTASAWSATTLSNITNLNQVACTSAASPTCVGVGDGPSGGTVFTTSSDLGTVTPETSLLPQNPAITDITQVVCPSTNGCYLAGSNGNRTGAAGWSGRADLTSHGQLGHRGPSGIDDLHHPLLHRLPDVVDL